LFVGVCCATPSILWVVFSGRVPPAFPFRRQRALGACVFGWHRPRRGCSTCLRRSRQGARRRRRAVRRRRSPERRAAVARAGACVRAGGAWCMCTPVVWPPCMTRLCILRARVVRWRASWEVVIPKRFTRRACDPAAAREAGWLGSPSTAKRKTFSAAANAHIHNEVCAWPADVARCVRV
jgi:hypothetical protein